VLERQEHDPTFRFRRARERSQIGDWIGRIRCVRRRLLRRLLQLPELGPDGKMKGSSAIFSRETILFLRDLGRNNHKAWMDQNRERYRRAVTEPFRALLACLTPAALKLNRRLVVSGRVGENFSRINRDIRFSMDKAPYRTQMYLFFAEPGGEGGQIYTAVSADTVTCGFRIYGPGRGTPLIRLGRARAIESGTWLERQKRRLGRKYESYWYSSEKGQWTKHKGWPVEPGEWKKLKGWVVRRKLRHASLFHPGFEREVKSILREVYPLLPFTSSTNWKG
jgi:uncharacterized protein (TIGR02453 family)